MRLSLTIAGPAGLGFNSLGVMIGRVFAGLGYFVIGDPLYSSRIRGGVNCFRLYVSDTEYFLSRECDILMPFDSTNAKAFSDTLSPSGCIIANAKIAEKISAISAPQYCIHHEEKFDNIYFFGVFGKLFLLEKELLLDEIETLFAHKPDVRDANRSILEKAYEEDIPQSIRELFAQTRIMRVGKPKQFTYGNALIAEGAVKAGLNYYAGYPMTPASSLLVECAKHPGVTVLQPEDEIAVANSVLGAHFAGARAMCGTSGGGFALMSEALSFADQAEIGGVFILSSRAGPSTGTPTFTEYADIDFALTPTFGGIRHIVMAPSDGHDAYTLIQHALNHADQFQIPVIFLIDKQLSESYISCDDDFPPVPIDRGKLILDDIPEDSFARYALTPDSLSPRTVPGVKNGDFIATSYEHDTYGATSEDRAMKIRMTEKRFHKTDSLFSESIHGYEIVHPGAKKMFVVAGMMSMVARSFVEQHSEYGLIIIRYLKPFDLRIREEIGEVEEFIFLEMNYSGQLEHLVREEIGAFSSHHIAISSLRKYDLLPFTFEDLEQFTCGKTILVDAWNTFVTPTGIDEPLYALLERFPNKKIMLTNANTEEKKRLGIVNMPFEVFSLEHNPNKTDPGYYETMLTHFGLNPRDVLYFEHDIDAVHMAKQCGITVFHFDHEKRDLHSLEQFLEQNLKAVPLRPH